MTAINHISKDDIMEFVRNPDLDNYQRFALKSAIYPGKGTPLGLLYVSLKGCGETGEFAEHVGKAMRDDNLIPVQEHVGPVAEHVDDSRGERSLVAALSGTLTPERREKLILEIGDDLWYLAAKCQELGITLGEAAIRNLQKLSSRSERGTLRGSGDDR